LFNKSSIELTLIQYPLYNIYVIVDIFGELSTSDEDDEKDVNIMDSEDDVSRQQNYMKMEDSNSQMKRDDLISLDSFVLPGGQSLEDSQACMYTV
jgi:hypothetical protein